MMKMQQTYVLTFMHRGHDATELLVAAVLVSLQSLMEMYGRKHIADIVVIREVYISSYINNRKLGF